MEGHAQPKNILYLFIFFCLGFGANILLVHWQDIDIFSLIHELNEETVVEEIAQDTSQEVLCETVSKVVEEEDLCPVLVDISGAVVNPGVYCFPVGASVIDAVKKAKGFTTDAGFKYISMRINLATVMLDNSKIYVPFQTDYNCSLLTFNLPKEVVDITIPDEEAEGESEGQEECVSINSGTQSQLETLDGVGPSTALKIIQGRPYEILEDLLNVSGIGEATFNKFKEDICL
jgi:competence protein ComEA